MSHQHRLLLLLFLLAPLTLWAQEEKTTGGEPETPVATALEDGKVPSTAAEAKALEASVKEKLAAIPADTTDKKELREAYDTQVSQLGQLIRVFTALETFDAKREELQKQKSALEAEQRDLPDPVEPTLGNLRIDENADTEARTLLAKLERELGEASNRLTRARQDRQELAALIEGTGKTIEEKDQAVTTAAQALREAQKSGTDVVLREEQIFARRLEREVLVQRKAFLEKEQTTARRQLEEEIALLVEALAKRRANDQSALRDAIAKALADLQKTAGQTALQRAERERDRHAEGSPRRVLESFKVEALLAQQTTTDLRLADSDLDTKLTDLGVIAALGSEAVELARDIKKFEEGDGEGLMPESAEDIREVRDAARSRATAADDALELLRQAAIEFRTALKLSNKAHVRVQSRVDRARREARANQDAPARNSPSDQDWIDVASLLQKALGDQITELQRQGVKIENARDEWSKLREIAGGNVAFFNDQLRWTREESHITFKSIEDTVTDGLDALEHSPEISLKLSSGVLGYLGARERRGRMIAVGVLLAAFGILLWLMRKRMPKTYNWIEEQSKDGNRFFGVLGIYWRRLDLSFMVALLFVGVPWAAGMEARLIQVSACLFATPFLYRFGRATLDIFFLPGGNDIRFFDLEEKLAVIVHRAGRWVLNLTLFFVPAGFLMGLTGYGDRNPGFVELWWLVHGVLTQLVLLFSIFRPIVVRSLIRGQSIVAVSVKTWILIGYPFVVGGTIFTFLLGSLRYETAQDYFQIIILKSLGLMLGAYIVYRIVLRAALRERDVGERPLVEDFDSEEAYLEAGKQLFTAKLIRTLLRLSFALPVFFVIRRFWAETSMTWVTTSLNGAEGVSLYDICVSALVLWATGIVVVKVRDSLSFVILPNTKLDRGLRYTVVMLTTYGLWVIGSVIALQFLKVRGEHIAVFTGALAFGVGFGLQSIVKNFVSGLILLIERPVKIGDMVEVENKSGSVDKITLRATTVMTWDGIGVVIPNEVMVGGNLINYSLGHPRLRSTLAIGVAYGSEVQKVRKLINEVVNNHGLVLKRPEPETFFIGFGDSSLDFQVNFWTSITTHRPRTLSDLRFALDAAFRRESVEIPFPQRDLNVRTIDGTVVAAFGGARLPRPGDGGGLDHGPASAQGESVEKSSS